MRTPSQCRLDLTPPLADRFIFGVAPIDYGPVLLRMPSDSITRWTPCPPEIGFSGQRRSSPPSLGYGAPHSNARGTATLLSNPLLSAHCKPLRLPYRPSHLSRVASCSFRNYDHRCGFPCCVWSPIADMPSPLPRQI